MKSRFMALVLAVLFLVSCGGQSGGDVKTIISKNVNWQELKAFTIMAALGDWDKGRLEQYQYAIDLVRQTTNQTLEPDDFLPLCESIDAVGNPVVDSQFESLVITAEELLDPLSDNLMSLTRERLDLLDDATLSERSDNVCEKLRIDEPFVTVVIGIDPSLAPGLCRVNVGESDARLYIHPDVSYDTFEHALIAAYIEREMPKGELESKQIDSMTLKYGTCLTGREQFVSDFAYSLQLWIGGEIEPDLMTYLVYSSVKYNHVFSAQLSHWSGNFMQFKDMTLEELVPYGIEDASKPIYEKLLKRLVDPARLGIVLGDSVDGVVISELVKDSPAQFAGVLPGDVIVKLDTEDISSRWMLERKLYDKDPDSYIILKVKRDADKPTDGAIDVVLSEVEPNKNIVAFQFLVTKKSNLPDGVY
ncbi:MAG TPA: PDZ domain-containing protein [Caldisericia bacterium]|nr:PDZ domain-containing protein [Caldisericia bacterium]HPF48577.1 PDZ domain-containing protein [Caldisericia bacterium]HPI83763.1 PDZ domain-containing protein [Caldisericia bacterium]HPQ93032.1 PDZ domain-containing protein [Caldisericia bacterium]HRV75135.1 PDZ domain-containing protein [Caldisericia bacterium]